VDLAEGAVQAGGPAVGSAHGRGLGAYEDAAAVLGEQRELVHLASGCVHGGHQPLVDLLGVGAAHRPSGEAVPSDGFGRAPA
jgi:hypothetical protein